MALLLDEVAVRLTPDQLIRQVLQGRGNMPAYGKNLTPAETTALVAFLSTCRPSNEPPARVTWSRDSRQGPRRCCDGLLNQTRAAKRRSLGVMQSFVQICLSSLWIGWTNAGALTLTVILYFRGWSQLNRILPERYSRFELIAFLTGTAAIWLALAPPMEALSALLLAAQRRIQHLLLLVVAPPLLLLSRPSLPILRGLPRSLAHDGIAPFLHSSVTKKLETLLSQLLPCWLAFVGTLILCAHALCF